MWSIKLPGSISCMEVAELKMKNIQALLVSINPNDRKNKCGEVQVYVDKTLVDVIVTEDLVTSMKFGRFGREADSLVMIANSGMLMVKMLKRTAQLNEKLTAANAKDSQKLEIPRKTKLFLDNVAREKEFSKGLWDIFI